jgi:putative transposase
MALVKRKVTYKLYPTTRQEAILLEMLGAHQRLYNAALEQRIRAYRSVMRVSVSYYPRLVT